MIGVGDSCCRRGEVGCGCRVGEVGNLKLSIMLCSLVYKSHKQRKNGDQRLMRMQDLVFLAEEAKRHKNVNKRTDSPDLSYN